MAFKVGQRAHRDCLQCAQTFEFVVQRGRHPEYCAEHRRTRLRLVGQREILECERCGFNFSYEIKKGSSRPWYCSECRPVARAEAATRNNAKRTRKQKNRINERRRLSRHGYPHAYRGLTEAQWVARWHECPWLFEKLVDDLVASVRRYPDWETSLEHYRKVA